MAHFKKGNRQEAEKTRYLSHFLNYNLSLVFYCCTQKSIFGYAHLKTLSTEGEDSLCANGKNYKYRGIQCGWITRMLYGIK